MVTSVRRILERTRGLGLGEQVLKRRKMTGGDVCCMLRLAER